MGRVTDAERREVARRLRELDKEENYKLSDFIWAIIATSNEHISVPAYLADLIEPSIPADPGEAGLASVDGFIREMRHSTKEEQNEYSVMLKKMSVELHPVDRDALLEIAQAMESRGKCASEVNGGDGEVDAWWLRQYAHLIREAMGVSDGW